MESANLSLPHLVYPCKLNLLRPPLLLLLHGVSSNEQEIAALVAHLDERFLVVSPRAPFETSPGRFSWFRMMPMGGALLMDMVQLEFSRQALIKFIHEAVAAYKANPAHVFVFGFSQGATVGLSLALTEPELTAGVSAMGGQIPQELRSLIAPLERLKGLPVQIVHGTQDDLCPVSHARQARALLAMMPVLLSYGEFACGHYLTQDVVNEVRHWLAARLDSKGLAAVVAPAAFKAHLGHVQVKVRNLDRAIAFYVHFLGLTLVERVGNVYAFLSSGSAHHELALQNVGMEAPAVHDNAVGLAHVAFDVADVGAFATAYKALIEAGVPVVAIDHLIAWSLNFHDPDNNGVEISWDTRHLPGRSDRWQGRDLPLSPEKILAVLAEKR